MHGLAVSQALFCGEKTFVAALSFDSLSFEGQRYSALDSSLAINGVDSSHRVHNAAGVS